MLVAKAASSMNQAHTGMNDQASSARRDSATNSSASTHEAATPTGDQVGYYYAVFTGKLIVACVMDKTPGTTEAQVTSSRVGIFPDFPYISDSRIAEGTCIFQPSL